MGKINFVSRGGLRGCVELMREWEGVLCFSIVVETSLTDKNKQMSSAYRRKLQSVVGLGEEIIYLSTTVHLSIPAYIQFDLESSLTNYLSIPSWSLAGERNKLRIKTFLACLPF